MKADEQRAATRNNLFDMLNTMREAAWSSFNERRQHEWKICITLWSLLTLFPAALVGNGIPLLDWQRYAAVGAILLIAAMHAIFMDRLANALRIDRLKARHYEDRIRKLIGARLPLEHHVRVRRSESWPGINLRASSARRQLSELSTGECIILRDALYRVASPLLSAEEHRRYSAPRGPDRGPCGQCERQRTCQDMLPTASLFGFWSHALQIAFTFVLALCGIIAVLTLTESK